MKSQSFTIAGSEGGQTVAAYLKQRLKVRWKEARRLIRGGVVQVDGDPCLDPGLFLRQGQRLRIAGASISTNAKNNHKPKSVESGIPAKPDPFVYFEDKHIIVIEKPAGITTVRHAHEAKEFGERAKKHLPDTLADVLSKMLARKNSGKLTRVRAVHRLDKETSGIVVFALTKEAERNLGIQLRERKVGRRYLALVRGKAKTETIKTHLIDNRGDGRRGSTTIPVQGKLAVTHVRVMEEFDGFSLVECVLETGRTHQVRIHLGERNTPLCGERIYDRPLHSKPLRDDSGADRTMLHAAYLQIAHPVTDKKLSWSSPAPDDMKQLLKKLRRTRK